MVDWKKAIYSMGMTPPEYIRRFALPIILLGIGFPVLIQIAAPTTMQGSIKYVLYSIPLLFLILIVMYPLNSLDSKKKQIDNNIHYYVAEMGVLATSQMQLKDILYKVSQNEAYENLAKESKNIYSLMNDYNLTFSQSCRFIARRTPSYLFADFLDRFAHSSDSGENVETFLRAEHKVVMNAFDTMYKEALASIELIKEMYTSMIMALIFVVSFTIILPVIMDVDAAMLMAGSILMFLGTEVLFVYFASLKVPKDRIWHKLDIETEADKAIKIAFPISIFICLLISIPILLWGKLPITLEIAIILTPLILTGKVASKEENKIKRKDDNFASFIRSLGASAGARGGLVVEALKHLIYHDFGPLTKNVGDLYKRLNIRGEKKRSWELFAAGTGSNLIERFGNIFAEGIHVGGKPEIIGEIISDTAMGINSLRKLRYSSSATLMNMLYGLTAGIAFTLFLSLSILKMLSKVFSAANSAGGMDVGVSFSSASNINIGFLTFLLMVLLVGHSLLSAILVRVVDGGHMFNIYTHFVFELWVSAICAELILKLSSSLININM